MPTLLIHESTYYAQLDEDAFYRWLGAIAGVRKIEGTPNGLQVTFRSSTLSESALRDLVALHWRYRLPMRDLAQFQTAKNEAWFTSRDAYWHEGVFGPHAVSADLNSRIHELRAAGTTKKRAVSAIQKEYRLQGTNEAERRVAVSQLWAGNSHSEGAKPHQRAKSAA